MNSRYTPILAAALLASAASAPLRAQDNDQPPAPPAAPTLARPVTPPATDKALLRYKFAPGQVLRYSTVADLDMKITTSPQSPGIPIKQHIETVSSQTVQSVDAAKDATTLAVKIESIAMTLNGQSVPTSEAMKAQLANVTTLVLSSTGKVLSVKIDAPTKTPGFDMSKVGVYQQNGVFPTDSVKPGDTWKSLIDVSAVGAKVTSNFKLSSLTPSDGAVIAQIAQSVTGVISSSAATALPAGFKLGGAIHMNGVLLFDVDAGSIKSQTSTGHFDATVNAPAPAAAKPSAKTVAKQKKPAATAGAAKVHMDMTTTTTRVDSDAPAAPAPAAQ
ncbi:hypothetical protein CCAX7_30280 [Capsulimonas corticalis]|uniref:DUF5666 domain-containing protein n=1 Tax=Capsulimonas corticalis TaxID=2219043 RepID=A0A9N7L4Q5_9BACT|nr:hypothetical protein [Capsulimonas corticalis]BDI30977.1 hypothetical protein CCAX7_30280 [Capsulimonas corticalis]